LKINCLTKSPAIFQQGSNAPLPSFKDFTSQQRPSLGNGARSERPGFVDCLFQQRLLSRLRDLPGVQEVSLGSGSGGRGTVTLMDEGSESLRQLTSVPFADIEANYLDTIGTPIVQPAYGLVNGVIGLAV
jgi:hypothetical protein